jgi:hypothetical protein
MLLSMLASWEESQNPWAIDEPTDRKSGLSTNYASGRTPGRVPSEMAVFRQKPLASAKAVPAMNKLGALPMQREVSGTALADRTVIFVSLPGRLSHSGFNRS